MKNKLPADLPTWLLRIGLAFVFLYAGVASLRQPLQWVGYLPTWLATGSTALTMIKAIAIGELVLAIWLLSGKFSRYAGLLAALMLAGIVVFNPNQFLITFRDVGLVFMALALALSPEK